MVWGIVWYHYWHNRAPVFLIFSTSVWATRRLLFSNWHVIDYSCPLNSFWNPWMSLTFNTFLNSSFKTDIVKTPSLLHSHSAESYMLLNWFLKKSSDIRWSLCHRSKCLMDKNAKVDTYSFFFLFIVVDWISIWSVIYTFLIYWSKTPQATKKFGFPDFLLLFCPISFLFISSP